MTPKTTLNQYINVAVAKKLAAQQGARDFFSKRAEKGNIKKALRLLDSLGTEETPEPGDEL